MNAELSAVCVNVLSAVLNGMAQGILLVLLLAGAFRVFRKMNAATRHGLELMTLVLLIALPITHFLLGNARPPVLPLSTPEFSSLPDQTVPIESALPPKVTSVPLARPATISIPPYVSATLVALWCAIGIVRLAFLMAQLLT